MKSGETELPHFTSMLLPTHDNSGDAVLQIPPEVLAALGLTEGSAVEVTIDKVGRLIITPVATDADINKRIGVAKNQFEVPDEI